MITCKFCQKKFEDETRLKRHQSRSKICKGTRKLPNSEMLQPGNEVLKCLGGKIIITRENKEK